MCRSITPLRGLEPAATNEEITAAARQFVRKVASLSTAKQMEDASVQRAISEIAVITERLLGELPERRHPPAVVPPGRRR